MIYWQQESLKKLIGIEKKKYQFKLKIIKYLFLHGESTGSAIAYHIKLSNPSVIANLNELIRLDVVEERGRGNSTGGRRPTIYGLKMGSFFIMCIDIGRFNVRMAIVDNNRNFISAIRSYDLKLPDNEQYINILCEHALDLMEKAPIDKEKIIGIGVDMPGIIDSVEGINYSSFYLPTGSLAKKMEEKLKRPVFLENDAKARALGEYWFGLAKGKKHALVLLLSWGIGLGMILDGRLYRGTSGFAGEFSHIPFQDNGKLCWCKKRGCLESVASASALSSLAKEGIKSGNESSISHLIKDVDIIDPDIIVKAAKQGDQFSINILSQVAYELGKGIALLIQLFNPEIIILGGRMAKAEQYMVTPIQQALHTYSSPMIIKDISIHVSELGDAAAILGLATIVVEKLLDD
jgi:N-acetylglucosamine repressor